MRRAIVFSWTVALLATGGCRAPAVPEPAAPATPSVATSRPATPAATPTATSTAAAPARVDGYGPLRFGMEEAAMRTAWDGPALQGVGGGEDCHYLSPQGQAAPAMLAFMLEGGRFVRYDVGQDNTAMAAPGGGRIGQDATALRALYPGARVLPHKYVPEGSVLRVPLAGDAVLVFETGADGRVSAWRVGVPPQVDYVEGCS